ncbi:MAG: (2Fe-2S)-binding protein [Candidatus Aminicenantes bacterium]|nr:MAG: (2Fe-2S)-binding protein [Candidatus Aminicenantes bacterium]
MKKEDSEPQNISRRKFIKGVGTGVIGGTIIPGVLTSEPAKKKQETSQPHEGKVLLPLKVNGKAIRVLVEPRTTLAQLLRDQLNLIGAKITCNHGECGTCTVLLDGKAIYSCHILALDAAGKEVTTIEGLLNGEKLHPLQEAFIEHDGFQCGFCTPGQIMAARALLLKHPKPTTEQVKEGMAGNLCRCSSYPHIVKSVMAAAEKTTTNAGKGG